MSRWACLLMLSLATMAATPLSAQTQVPVDQAPVDQPPVDQETLRAAIAEAKAARQAAADALRKADELTARLEALLNTRPAPLPVQKSALALKDRPTTQKPTEWTKRATIAKDMRRCDSIGDNGVPSIGQYMIDMGKHDKLKKEGSQDTTEDFSDRGINAFVYHCLGLINATDYESITDLSVQFSGIKGNEQGEFAVTRTARALKPIYGIGDDGKRQVTALFPAYNRYTLGGFGRTGKGGDVPLIDLTTSNFESGVGVLAGFEWGRSADTASAKLVSNIHDGIAKARQECLAANWIIDPLTAKTAATDARPTIADNPLSQCEGNNFVEWLSRKGNANRYWTAIVAPLWGYKTVPETRVGLEVRYAFQDVTYRPIIDPATGDVFPGLLALPDEITINPEPYSVKLYGGFNRKIGLPFDHNATWGLTGSLTYRREVDFIKGTSGQTFCTPAATGASFDTCRTDQRFAAPYQTSGFVGGLAMDMQLDRLSILPPIATSPRVTYAFDTDRFGIEIPVYFLTDADGKLNSGIQYTCRFRGETPEGFELKKSCNIGFFLGTNFQIGRSP